MKRPIEILLVEDSPEDVDLTHEALKEANIDYKLNVVKDGIEAMRYLKKMGPYFNNRRPDLIVLDLNLPMKSGFEVLDDIQMDGQLNYIPTIVLTTSDLNENVLRLHGISTKTYVKKSLGLQKLVDLIKEL